MDEQYPIIINVNPELTSSTLIIGWNEDVGRLGTGVIDYITDILAGVKFAEIDPTHFFPLGGVAVDKDVAQFPESNFFYCQDKQLVLFKSNFPRFDWYKFLDTVLEVAQHICHVREIVTIGGMVYMGAHTTPRQLLAVANSRALRDTLAQYELTCNLDYDTPPGQRPTLSSYLMWVAKKRNIPAASLWVPIPFYFIEIDDPRSWKKVLQFFNIRLNLGLDFTELNNYSTKLNERMAQLRQRSLEIDSYIQKLESNILLTQEESEKLAHDVYQFLNESN